MGFNQFRSSWSGGTQVLPVYPRKLGISGAGALDVAEAAWIYVTGEALSP